jgi:hypothetical protein
MPRGVRSGCWKSAASPGVADRPEPGHSRRRAPPFTINSKAIEVRPPTFGSDVCAKGTRETCRVKRLVRPGDLYSQQIGNFGEGHSASMQFSGPLHRHFGAVHSYEVVRRLAVLGESAREWTDRVAPFPQTVKRLLVEAHGLFRVSAGHRPAPDRNCTTPSPVQIQRRVLRVSRAALRVFHLGCRSFAATVFWLGD